jgi:AcrR family transcriptional regulator
MAPRGGVGTVPAVQRTDRAGAAATSVAPDRAVTTILEVTADMLGAEGFDKLVLREVARRARVSLSTIYKHFPSREELVVAAVRHWMASNVYRALPERQPDEPLPDVLIRSFRHVFTPWLHNPTMLTVFLRAALLPGGESLGQQGEVVNEAGERYFAGYDPGFAEDVQTILTYLTHGLLSRFATGELEVEEIVQIYEQAVHRLTAPH